MLNLPGNYHRSVGLPITPHRNYLHEIILAGIKSGIEDRVGEADIYPFIDANDLVLKHRWTAWNISQHFRLQQSLVASN